MKTHEHELPSGCICDITALEPDEKCPVHSGGDWPPRCVHCGRFMKWPDTTLLDDYEFMYAVLS